jgi:hypothetical protein
MNTYLITGALLSAVACILHIGCIVFGSPWYRFLGAGETMAQLSDRGSMRPTLITSMIAAALALGSLYALSGAGVIPVLPRLHGVLSIVTAVFLGRGILGFFLIIRPMGRSSGFWFWSSAICLAIGLIHFVGLIQIQSTI